MFSYDSMGTGGALGPTQIRLLHLLPAKESTNPIACRLEVVAFEENPVYEALSYCWGDNTLLQGTKCNNEAFQVTESLFSGLQHLRNDHTERTLWIDAICINQNDLEERQSQVKLMKDIYTKSERVVIWLGPDPPLMESTTFPDEIKNDFVRPNEAKKGAIAVLTRPWWTRTWTVQEMVLAPSAIIMCGHLSAPASEARRACADDLMHAVKDAFDAGDDDDLLSFRDLVDDPNGTLYMARM
ncbi:hypothetical protein J7337_006175 [Fusarium musae]|uniref:Heterokaryon incompatibility domain-containing protein n=1 Tax=Fusarium musae TaxID=1042133 RepID=A0A9P8IRZ7_9HYPO|nr:hypothetical protein J7337_006175 [Fusarium musae]KAG9503330.1 hypothetical protein J7337_006175 [Fusarium musae]